MIVVTFWWGRADSLPCSTERAGSGSADLRRLAQREWQSTSATSLDAMTAHGVVARRSSPSGPPRSWQRAIGAEPARCTRGPVEDPSRRPCLRRLHHRRCRGYNGTLDGRRGVREQHAKPRQGPVGQRKGRGRLLRLVINPLAVSRYRDRHAVLSGAQARSGCCEGAGRQGPYRPAQALARRW